MIDYFDIEIPIRLPTDLLRRQYGGAPLPDRPPRIKRRIKSEHWMSVANVIFVGDSLRICCCPQKILGRWNTRGSSDLRAIVVETVPMVLRSLGHVVSENDERMLACGKYRICELHIAQTFALPDLDIHDFVTRVFHAVGPSHRPEWAQRGHGFFFKPGNRRVSFYLYDKLQEWWSRGQPRYRRQLDQAPAGRRPWIALQRNAQLAAAAIGPRLELRFGDQFFRHHPLQHGRSWGPTTALTLYLQQLKKLELPPQVAVAPDLDRARHMLKVPQFQALTLWSLGADLPSLYSAPTLRRHRQHVLQALALDIRTPPPPLLQLRELPIAEVLSPANLVNHSELGDDEWDHALDRGWHSQLRYIGRR